LKPGAFDVQGIVTVPTVRLMNRLGVLTADQMRVVETGICSWLGINTQRGT
jgi:mRNA interferase MazF